jgi:hypothetical protein
MRRLFSVLVTVTCLVLAQSCANDAPNLLLGQWTAFEILEEGEVLDINPSQIQLGFEESERYTYLSTLNYEEAGRYRVQTPYLYTTDTTAEQQAEKAVEIIQLTMDSLQLRMNDNGKERILKLLKTPADSSLIID